MILLSVDIPVLETDRLILRDPREGDAAASAAFIALDLAGFVGGGPDSVSRDGPRLFGLDAVISPIDPASTRSIRLAERMGGVVEREGELMGKPALIYRYPAERAAA